MRHENSYSLLMALDGETGLYNRELIFGGVYGKAIY